MGGDSAVLIILPDRDRIDAVTQNLTEGLLEHVDRALVQTEMTVTLPEFDSSSTVEWSGDETAAALAQLPLPVASRESRLGRAAMLAQLDLRKVRDDINDSNAEVRWEAITAFGAGVVTEPYPGLPFELRVDRPFILLIRQVSSGLILFCGRIMRPEGPAEDP